LKTPLGWLSDPLALLATETAEMGNRGANTRLLTARQAMAVTAGVLAIDATVLAYFHHVRSKKRRGQQLTLAERIFSRARIPGKGI